MLPSKLSLTSEKLQFKVKLNSSLLSIILNNSSKSSASKVDSSSSKESIVTSILIASTFTDFSLTLD